MAPTLCDMNVHSAQLGPTSSIFFSKSLKGGHNLQHQAFCLVREGSVSTKKCGTKPGLFFKILDWGAWNHSQALLLFIGRRLKILAQRF